MKKILVTIQGTSPLLMHKYPFEPIKGIEKKSAKEQAEIAAYRDESGVLFIPGRNVFRALISGGKFSKGRGKATLQTMIPAAVTVEPERLSLNVKIYEVDSQPGVNPTTKGRMMVHRPRLDKWAISFEIIYDETLLTEAQVREVVDSTGSRVGLLDFRPEKKGPYGKFIVVRWETE